MNQENWGMCENHGYNHYSNNSCDDEFYNNGCNYGDQYESHDNDWQWTDNSGHPQYQESPFFSENQNQYQESPFFSESQYHDNDWQWTDNSGQNQYQESPSFERQENQYQEAPYYSENHDSLDEYSSADKSDEMLDMMKISFEMQECNQKLDKLLELLNQQPSDNTTDTTQLEEVSFLYHDEPFDNKEHEPTPPLVEVVMKDYVSWDNTDSESDYENNEVVTDLENFNETFHDLSSDELSDTKMHEPTQPELEVVVEVDVPLNDKRPENEEVEIGLEKNEINLNEPIRPKVGEGSVEANTNPDPTELKACEKQKRVLLFELTNDPPSSDDTLESCLPCFRTKALECQVMEGRFLSKKDNATYAYKSKMKVFYGIKLQRKKFTRRRDVLFFKQRWKFSHKNLKGKRFGLKVKGNTPFDPGGI